MRRAWFLPLLSLIALCWGTPRAAARPDSLAVVRSLQRGECTPREAVAAWRSAGVGPGEALARIRGLRPAGGLGPGVSRLDLRDALGRRSYAEVFVPEAPRPDGRYGVLLALHGLGGNAGQMLRLGRRLAPPGTVVLAPNAQKLGPGQENEDTVLNPALTSRVLPHWWSYREGCFPLRALDLLKERLPVDTDRVLLLGYSMGGYGAWNLGLRFSDRFAGMVPLAGGLSRLENFVPRDGRVRPLLRNARMLPAWVLHGERDRTVPVRFSRSLTAELTRLGADCTYHEVPGAGHVVASFLRGDELTAELRGWLAERGRDPHPRRVEHTAIAADHAASYWLRLDVARPGAWARAEVEGPARVVVQAHGVRRLTVFFDPRLLDCDEALVVEVNGVVRHRGRVEPSLEAVADSFAADRDPALVWSRALTVDLAD
ncbi:MAG: hypothetical protein D6731_05670 [Planctomycetota bacterium]|nr:MAG: hypothetical protein D6731_05670 [Planctomycetota bacterium]